MAMDKAVLGQAIVDKIQSNNGEFTGLSNAERAKLLDFCTSIGEAVIEHLKTADIEFPAGMVPVPGVGLSNSGGPVSGTAFVGAFVLSGKIK